MSIYFEVDVSGSTIGYKLSTDAEEAAHALMQLASDADEDFIAAVPEFTVWKAEEVVEFLRKLADAIEAGAAG